MKNVEKIYDATTRNKLTISPERAAIRFKKGSTQAENERVEKFLMKVINEVLSDSEYQKFKNTIRGNLAYHEKSDTFYIVMNNEAGTYSKRLFESEI